MIASVQRVWHTHDWSGEIGYFPMGCTYGNLETKQNLIAEHTKIQNEAKKKLLHNQRRDRTSEVMMAVVARAPNMLAAVLW